MSHMKLSTETVVAKDKETSCMENIIMSPTK